MYLKVAFSGETAAADVALERPFAGMRSDMNLKRRIGTKHFTTVSAAVLEKRFIAAFALVFERHLIGKTARKDAPRCRVQHFFGTLLKHLQRIETVHRRRLIVVGYDCGGECRTKRRFHGGQWIA